MAYLQINGNKFEWQHDSWEVKNQRLGSSKPTASGGHSRSDGGAWKKEFKVTVLCQNKNLDSEEEENIAGKGKEQRDLLRTLFAQKDPVTLITPDGDTFQAYFNGDMTESFMFAIPQDGGYEYEIPLNFIEE